jgi:hypothetical protein
MGAHLATVEAYLHEYAESRAATAEGHRGA